MVIEHPFVSDHIKTNTSYKSTAYKIHLKILKHIKILKHFFIVEILMRRALGHQNPQNLIFIQD
jgi:hypothetical protein